MTTHYVTDGTANVTIAPNGIRRGDGWHLTPSWSAPTVWVANKRDAEREATALLTARRAHVSAVRSRVLTALAADAATVSAEVVERLVAEFSK